MRHALLLAALCGLLALTCPAAEAQLVGLPNPASAFCADWGGRLAVSDTGTGQVGTCVYDGGLAVDEWALYRLFSGLTDPLAW